MINMIIRYYNQNRRKILIFILVVASVIILTQLLNELTKKQNEKQYNNYFNTENSNELLDKDYIQNSQHIGTNQISNTTNSSETEYYEQSAEQVIKQFVEFCNENDFNNAYEMLTDDCKKVLFPTINDFQKNYVQKIFYQNKTAKIEESMYNSSIYKVSYYTNMLSSGGYGQDNILQDYIRVTKENGKNKISLNRFLAIETLDKEANTNSIYMKAIQKEVYIDFEIYQIQIMNKTDNTILISKKEDNNSIYIVDKKEIEYPSNIDEQELNGLILKSQANTILNIKFNKIYSTDRRSKEIRFTDIVTNYEQYQKGEEPEIIRINILL